MGKRIVVTVLGHGELLEEYEMVEIEAATSISSSTGDWLTVV